MIEKRDFYINGQWVDPTQANDLAVIDPTTEEPCAVITPLSRSPIKPKWISALKKAATSGQSFLKFSTIKSKS